MNHSHVVLSTSPDGAPSWESFDGLSDAVAHVEGLRNERGVEAARIFELREVKFSFRPVYLVEMDSSGVESGGVSGGAIPEEGSGAGSDPGTGPEIEGAEPEASADLDPNLPDPGEPEPVAPVFGGVEPEVTDPVESGEIMSVHRAPAARQPVDDTRAVMAQAPVVEIPAAEAHDVGAPITEVPGIETPVVRVLDGEVPEPEAPVVDAPAVEAPLAEKAEAETPAVEPPMVNGPVVAAPAVAPPAVAAPAVEAPVAMAPVVVPPVVEAPVVEAPVVEAPVDPAWDEPMPAPVSAGIEADSEWADDRSEFSEPVPWVSAPTMEDAAAGSDSAWELAADATEPVRVVRRGLFERS